MLTIRRQLLGESTKTTTIVAVFERWIDLSYPVANVFFMCGIFLVATSTMVLVIWRDARDQLTSTTMTTVIAPSKNVVEPEGTMLVDVRPASPPPSPPRSGSQTIQPTAPLLYPSVEV